jgi:hypothetical protein
LFRAALTRCQTQHGAAVGISGDRDGTPVAGGRVLVSDTAGKA